MVYRWSGNPLVQWSRKSHPGRMSFESYRFEEVFILDSIHGGPQTRPTL